MGAKLEITAAAPELMDAVIYMDNSPAYAAFREEIEAILTEYNSTNHLSHHWQVDPQDLTEKSEDTMKNMQRAFLIWTYSDCRAQGKDNIVHTYVKLFAKSELDTLIRINGGSEYVETDRIAALIESYKNEINSDSVVFNRVKEFFKGYVYGYFFNFLEEATIMGRYAEMVAFLGVMSNIVNTTASQKQKTVPKMAPLLQIDRFQYISGFIPFELITEIIYDRVELATASDNEKFVIKSKIADFIRTNYTTDSTDGEELVADNVTTDFSTKFFSYINSSELSKDIYRNTFSGVRTFLDCDRDDTGDYSSARILELISDKLTPAYDSYYDNAGAAKNDTSLGGSYSGYRYPIILKSDGDLYFSTAFEEFVYPALDAAVFTESDVPAGIFAFADEALRTNAIRAYAGLESSNVTVRRDRLAIVEQIKRLNADSIPEKVKKMLLLEQYLCLVSSNMNEAKYKALITEHVFGTDLYEEYIRYRMDILANESLTSLESKKTLLDEINRIG